MICEDSRSIIPEGRRDNNSQNDGPDGHTGDGSMQMSVELQPKSPFKVGQVSGAQDDGVEDETEVHVHMKHDADQLAEAEAEFPVSGGVVVDAEGDSEEKERVHHQQVDHRHSGDGQHVGHKRGAHHYHPSDAADEDKQVENHQADPVFHRKGGVSLWGCCAVAPKKRQ